MHRSPRRLLLAALAACLMLSFLSPTMADEPSRWYKGQTHFHSFWSDGSQFPEMVAERYKSLGYDFITPSDHNGVQSGEKWVDIGGRAPEKVFNAYVEKFGEDWVETKEIDGKRLVRLKTFDETQSKCDVPGEFLTIRSDEITGSWKTSQVHMNALNVEAVVSPQKGDSVADSFAREAALLAEQAERTGRTIFRHANHPSWKHYDVTAEDLAEASDVPAFEICNANSGSNYYGDDIHDDLEVFWDVCNTLRITKGNAPIYGVATDDTHNYHSEGENTSVPGRSFLMVRASELAPEPIMKALVAGDFYSSTGVELETLDFDADQGVLRVAVKPEEGVAYKIVFRGTREGYDKTTKTVEDPEHDGKPARVATKYSSDVGAVLATVEGPTAEYKFGGDELYVRAIVYSDKKMFSAPGGQPQEEMAWTQPVGWRKRAEP